jgi:hypothetical protein
MAEQRSIDEARLAATKSSYETDSLLSQYLSLHFGPLEIAFADFLAEQGILSDGLDFPRKCGDLVRTWAAKSGIPTTRALDLGCAVGRSTFELARDFGEVVGIDISQRFIDMADKMKATRAIEYELKEEGDIGVKAVATIDAAIDTSRVTFMQVGPRQQPGVNLGAPAAAAGPWFAPCAHAPCILTHIHIQSHQPTPGWALHTIPCSTGCLLLAGRPATCADPCRPVLAAPPAPPPPSPPHSPRATPARCRRAWAPSTPCWPPTCCAASPTPPPAWTRWMLPWPLAASWSSPAPSPGWRSTPPRSAGWGGGQGRMGRP